MDFEETMVEDEFDEAAADDTLPDGIVEDEDESEEEAIDDFTEEDLEEGSGEEDGQPAEDEPDEKPQGTSEPGWIKKRVEKAVQKALAQQQAEFERQMAPIREKMLTDEAKELVRQGEFKSLDRAKEYLQLKQGLPATNTGAESNPQPRNERGQYARNEDPATSARIDMLTHQANQIKAAGGPDVIAAFKTDEDIKQKVISGEMDFYDVAKTLKAQKPARKPPSPTRSPNGANGQFKSTIMSMTDKQFERLEKKVQEGVRFRLK